VYVDDVTVKADTDEDADFDDETAEVVEPFDIDDGTSRRSEQALDHDAAGNLEYDGEYKYTFDAWNRLVTGERAYANTPTTGSTIATITYDGLGRRIKKAVTNCGDWGQTYKYYHSGQSMIETRNGSDETLKQHVWGLTYVDELLQIAVNGDPATDNDCLETGASDASYYALQDANFNVIGLVGQTVVKVWDEQAEDWDTDTVWELVERYEYTPYGQRTIYKPTGIDDARTASYGDHMCSAPTLESQRVTADGSPATYGLCDVGHQGLMHDKEFGLIYNRARYLHPRLGRFISRDPLGYVDGMSLYEYVRSGPVGRVDPSGLLRSTFSPQGSGGYYPEANRWYRAKEPTVAQVARAALVKLHERHRGYLYYKADNGWMTGLRHLIWDKLNKALWWLDNDDFAYGPAPDARGHYDRLWNDMRLPRSPEPRLVVHEAIHAYNDWVDWKHEGTEMDEGVAYAVEFTLEEMNRFRLIENELRARGPNRPNVDQIGKWWRGVWENLNNIVDEGSAKEGKFNGKPFKIKEKHFEQARVHLGFKVRCQDFSALYNKQPEVKKACVEFLCSPNAKPTRATGLRPRGAIRKPFQ